MILLSSKLDLMAFVVSVVVIALMTIVFCFLFVLNNQLRKKFLLSGLDDDAIAKQLVKEFVPSEKDPKTATFYVDHTKQAFKSQRLASFISDIIFLILIVIILVCFCFAAIFRANNDLVFINNKAYMTVMTGSMSSVHQDNEKWLKDHGLFDDSNRIETYSLITIEKVEQEQLNVGDVVAYKDKENNIIIHRIVSISKDASSERSGTLYYTLRGDANNASSDEERSLQFEAILGRYTGYQSLELGAIIVYLQSNIGMIAMTFGMLIILLVGIFEEKLSNQQRNRLLYVASKLDGDMALMLSYSAKIRNRRHRILVAKDRKEKDDEPNEYRHKIYGSGRFKGGL